ncbi:hypothetical protein RHSP_07148 [Rhizobium freirei PRF 81]|uniref:Uncharacterized protein n=1 Tax=Rhizobium freirei PRF 81 TaxID=363754 RepID=N6U5H9_9HYPH|nr:hypothetical protein RHSP_07148 [Rhizobium freirei PRF 81]
MPEIGFAHAFARGACLIHLAEEHAQLARIGLAQERVELLDQRRNGGLLMHRLVRQRAELRSQCCDHPAREIEIATFGGTEVLLDGNDLLLTDKTVPTAERLRVFRRIAIIGFHILAHDGGRVASDVEACAEPVLQAHAGDRFGRNSSPLRVRPDQLPGAFDQAFVRHGSSKFVMLRCKNI